MAIVTRESITKMLENPNSAYVMRVVGRALVVLLNNQTADEQSENKTTHSNGYGFTGADARGGTLTAKSYLKRGTLEGWQIDRWTRLNNKGVPRLAKYHAQLNAAAESKRQ